MRKIEATILMLLLLTISTAEAQITKRELPKGWDKLTYGGQFMDRFLPMPDLNGKTADTWGADAVVPRDLNNGIESDQWSYWGGNIRLMDDGKYHLFVCRWPENSPKGHMEWRNSEVVHAVSDSSSGPFKVTQEIGKGHNPEWYITDSGKYVIYVIGGYYLSDSIDGPWAYNKFDFDNRDREIIEGLSNLTFAKREDGSMLMICRGGGVWISKDGISTWNQISDSRVYPAVEGKFEDPLVWKTDVQYHLIVNDWLGRIAWYLRSKDGVNWKTDAGMAYQPGVAKYEDGTEEDWFKYERMKVLQDNHGRAIQANFAVIDTIKWNDLPNDRHSSKLITIPLTIGKQISIINKKTIDKDTEEITIHIEAEDGFDPNRDLDIKSLRFGAPEKVDFGMGCKVKKTERDGDDLLITFVGEGNGITESNFAAKLLGKDSKGKLLFGYSRLPGVDYIESTLSPRRPIIAKSGDNIKVDIENFGQVSSKRSTVTIYKIDQESKIEIGHSTISAIKPYEKATVTIKTASTLTDIDSSHYKVVIEKL